MDENENKELDVVKDESRIDLNSPFAKTMDKVKNAVLEDAAVNDKKFVDTVKENLKNAAVTSTENEKKRAEFEGQQVDYESEKLNTKQQENAHIASENLWENKQKRRQFHYDGVKAIMQFVGISEPMNLFFLYFLTIVLVPFFLLNKFIRGTFGALVAGASNGDRPKAVQGFLWTILAVFAVMLLFMVIYLFLKWQGVDLIAIAKNIIL